MRCEYYYSMEESAMDEQGRPLKSPLDGDEPATVLGFLDYQRASFEWKCRGLSYQRLRTALVSAA